MLLTDADSGGVGSLHVEEEEGQHNFRNLPKAQMVR